MTADISADSIVIIDSSVLFAMGGPFDGHCLLAAVNGQFTDRNTHSYSSLAADQQSPPIIVPPFVSVALMSSSPIDRQMLKEYHVYRGLFR